MSNPQNEFAEAFPQETAAIAATIASQSQGATLPVGAPVGGRGKQDPTRLSGVSRRNYEKIADLENGLEGTPIEPATIVSVCPFPLKIYGILFEGLDVPACPIDQPYIMFVIPSYRVDWKEGIDGERTPTPYMPIKLAREFEKQYEKTGGVVVYTGTSNPSKDAKLLEMVKVAREQLATKYMLPLFHEADSEMRRPGGPTRKIGDQHRLATVWCHQWKKIAERPRWLDMTREEAQIAEPCPGCGHEGKKGAVICKECKYVLDPMRAYAELAIIGPDEPCLQRLSRAELDSIGLTEVPSRKDELEKVRNRKTSPKKKVDVEQ